MCLFFPYITDVLADNLCMPISSSISFFLFITLLTHGILQGIYIYWISTPSCYLLPHEVHSSHLVSHSPSERVWDRFVAIQACIIYRMQWISPLSSHILMWISQPFSLKWPLLSAKQCAVRISYLSCVNSILLPLTHSLWLHMHACASLYRIRSHLDMPYWLGWQVLHNSRFNLPFAKEIAKCRIQITNLPSIKLKR